LEFEVGGYGALIDKKELARRTGSNQQGATEKKLQPFKGVFIVCMNGDVWIFNCGILQV
jgi:hypothetical protein